jgi:hypothetical protein
MSNTKTAVKKETAKIEKAPEGISAEVKKSASKIDDILNPTADARIKKLETFNRLAEKKQKIDRKLDDLTNFNASNDGTLSKMEFTANNGYHFTISNPVTITKLLGFVEEELTQVKEVTGNEIINFQI